GVAVADGFGDLASFDEIGAVGGEDFGGDGVGAARLGSGIRSRDRHVLGYYISLDVVKGRG
ncbi:MAG: hypothetical protein ACRD22_11860, partial [Terriglobia bacterium]